MKLSEAILLGSVGSKQGYGILSINPNTKDRFGLCAMGAALFAIGYKGFGFYSMDDTSMKTIIKTWPWTETPINGEPLGLGPGTSPVYGIIWRLNDNLLWTRPQIAAWIASIEPQELSCTEGVNLDLTQELLIKQ